MTAWLSSGAKHGGALQVGDLHLKLDSPATVGCLYGVVCEVFGDEAVFVKRPGGWALAMCTSSFDVTDWRPIGHGRTRAEAALVALNLIELEVVES